jgi:hypothetical protein
MNAIRKEDKMAPIVSRGFNVEFYEQLREAVLSAAGTRVRLTRSRAFTYDAATGSVGDFMSINMPHEL